MLRRLALSFLLLAVAGASRAEVKLHNLFTDGAVLQRGMRVPVWGTARTGEKITVELFGSRQSTVAEDGRWIVWFRPMPVAGGPYTLIVNGDNRVQVNDLLLGEVWVCSGQSNMQWTVRDSAGAAELAAGATDPMIRLFTVPRRAVDTPERDVNARWVHATPETVPDFSAVAYTFGRALRKSLNVPIGLISTNYGGTPAEAWTRREVLAEQFPQILQRQDAALNGYPAALARYREVLRKYNENPVGNAPNRPGNPADSAQRPVGLYNAMIAPLLPYAIKGAIWYQGESNAGQAYEYRTLFPAMIKNWRDDWGQGDFPFLFVQLAPFMKIETEPKDSPWAELREAQSMTLKALPKTGQAVITDLGDENDIHPKRKTEVGERLALAAQAIAYGQKLEYSGPVYDSMRVRGDSIVLRFKHTGGGLKANGPLTGFAMAGADRKFVNAQAEIVGNTVVVRSASVPKPVAVRYGWANYPVVNLTNGENLPASPFRTDDFPMVTRPK